MCGCCSNLALVGHIIVKVVNDGCAFLVILHTTLTGKVPHRLPNLRAARHHHIATAVDEVSDGLHVQAATKLWTGNS